MKRELDADQVAAPYAAWLALSLVPEKTIRNLKAIRALGATGRYGLFEAIDFTPERCGGQKTVYQYRAGWHIIWE